MPSSTSSGAATTFQPFFIPVPVSSNAPSANPSTAAAPPPAARAGVMTSRQRAEIARAHAAYEVILLKSSEAARELPKEPEESLRSGPEKGIAKSLYDMGKKAFQEGNFSKAAEHYHDVLRLEPKSIAAHMDLAAALTSLGKLEDAKVQWMEALKLDPNNESARQNLQKISTLLETQQGAGHAGP